MVGEGGVRRLRRGGGRSSNSSHLKRLGIEAVPKFVRPSWNYLGSSAWIGRSSAPCSGAGAASFSPPYDPEP